MFPPFSGNVVSSAYSSYIIVRELYLTVNLKTVINCVDLLVNCQTRGKMLLSFR